MKRIMYKILYETEMYHWWYRVRRKIVNDIIIKYRFGFGGNLEILDIGCGTGALLKELEGAGTCYGIDISHKAVSFCKKRFIDKVRVGDVMNIPYPDNKFTIVLALDVIEHVKDDDKAIREIRRVLRPGGMAIIFVPAFNFLWGKSDELSNHYRRYTLRNLRSKIIEEKLSVVRSSYFNMFLFIPIFAVRLIVRWLRIPIKSENELGLRSVNRFLFIIFYIESMILKFFNLPFGVSALVICKK